MEKVKNVFGKIGAWIKAHSKIVIGIVVALIVVIILASILGGGKEKRAIKKYFTAVNSCDYSKIAKAMDLNAAVAWQDAQSSSSSYYSYLDSSKSSKDVVENFKDNLDDVDDDDVDSYKDNLKDQYDKDDKGKSKIKLLKVVSVSPAKDDKNLEKVVVKYRATSKPSKDDKDDSMVTFTNTNKYAYEINVGINSIFMDSNSIFLDLIRGNKIKCLENETVDDFLPDTNYSNNQVIIKNQYGNKFAINSEKKAIEDNQLILYIALRDYNILSLTPNKEICVRFDDTEYQEAYGGYYRLSSHTYTFNKEGTTFRSSGAIMLLKCKR